MNQSACPRCQGLLRFDDDQTGSADSGLAPALVCTRCARRSELTPAGEPLVVVQPLDKEHPMEERILVAHAQGLTAPKIARRLRCSLKLVHLVLQAGRPAEGLQRSQTE